MGTAPEATLLDTVERYFALLQAHVPAATMTAEILTDDFETGFVDGHMWRGSDGLRDFLHARSVFFDESHEILQILEVVGDDTALRARTRLRFFLRSRDPESAFSEAYNGEAFHAWRLRFDAGAQQWRVAAQIVEGFAMLDANSRRLFGATDKGLQT